MVTGKMSNPKPFTLSNSPRPQEISQEVFARVRPKLWRALSDLGAHTDVLEDLIQETFLLAHRSLSNFEGRSTIDTWIVGIGKGVWLHHKRAMRTLKREAQEVGLDQEEANGRVVPLSIESPVPTPEVWTTARDDLRRVGTAIQGLPESHCRPLLMQAAGYSYDQIGDLLGVSKELVTSRVFQARDKLRRMFPERRREEAR